MKNEESMLKELEILLSGKTMKKLTGVPKKCYKYALTAIFINILSGRQLTKGQEENFEIAYNIKTNPKVFNDNEFLWFLQFQVEKSLESAWYYNYNDYGTIDKIIEFFREIIMKTKKDGTYLITVNQIQNLLNVNKIYSGTHNHVQPHHWIQIDIFNGMFLTVPEFFTYVDVVNQWNMLLDKLDEYKDSMRNVNVPYIERKNNIENRRLKYEIDTLTRTLCVSSVTFVESYLYYLFYNLKYVGYQTKNESANSILKNQKVEDEEILKRVVLPEFFDNNNPELLALIKEYIKINKIRNRFIHTSAFQDQSNSSELLPLVTTSVEDVKNFLDVCIRLVVIIDNHLPEEYKILVWWDKVEHPVFHSLKRGNIINTESPYSKIKYLEHL